MATYHGTNGDDLIEQSALGPTFAADAYIYGGSGNDRIRVNSGSIEGEAGNDTLEGLGPGVSALYWGAPAGVHANLLTGQVQDGYGTVDTLSGIRVIGGSPHADDIIGSPADETFIGNGGSDHFEGGGGDDQVIYFDADPAQATFSYDEQTDTFTVARQFGDHGIDTLTGIDVIVFRKPDGTQAIVKPPQSGPMPEVAWVNVQPAAGAFLSHLIAGDFDGDGGDDLVVTQSVGTGTGAAPLLGFVQRGDGSLLEATSLLFAGGQSTPYAGALTPFAADLDDNGKVDLVALNFGDDHEPFDGGINSIFIAGASGLSRLAASAVGNVQATHHGGSAGDLDGDGDIDLLLNSLDEHSSYVLENMGALGWRVDDDMFAGLESSTCSLIADFDLDGRADVFFGKWAGDLPGAKSMILWGSATGYSTHDASALPVSGVKGETLLQARLIDLNGDDLPDLAVNLTSGGDENTYRTPYIQLLVNQGDGTFADETQARLPQALVGSTNNYSNLFVADFNQDGRDDLLAAGGGVVDSRIWIAQADGTFGEAWVSTNELATPIDMGSDGVWDIVSLAAGSTLTVHQNQFELGHVVKVAAGQHAVHGGPASEVLVGRSGDDSLDGAGGVDTVVVSAGLGDLAVARSGDAWKVTSAADGEDSLVQVERLHAADGWLALDIEGAAGATACIIGAVFGAAAVSNEAYVGIGLSLLDSGMTAQQLAGLALDVALGANAAPASIVGRLWTNVMGSAPSAADAAPFIAELEAGMAPSQLAWLAASTAMNLANVDLVGLAQTGLSFVPG